MDMHCGTFCKVIVDGSFINAGRNIVPFAAYALIDYVMRKVMQGMNYGIHWKGDQNFSDLEYADGIVLNAYSITEMQEMIERLVAEGEKVGLAINRRKTVIMKIQSDDQINNIIDGEILSNSDSFQLFRNHYHWQWISWSIDEWMNEWMNC